MARNTSPKVKIARRLGLALTDKQLRIMTRRNFPPGVHGPVNGHPRLSEFGRQLKEKQKAKFIYGILERQLKNYVKEATSKTGNSSSLLFSLLEQRIDNAVYRAGFAETRPKARQLVNHGHFLLNGKKVDIPSIQIQVGDIIEVKDKSKKSPVFAKVAERAKDLIQSSWINPEVDLLKFKIIDRPKVADMTGEFDPKMIIEFFSK